MTAARDDRDQIAPAAFYGSAGAAGHYTGSPEFIEVDLQIEVAVLVDDEVVEVRGRAVGAKDDAAGRPTDDGCLHFKGEVGKVGCQREAGVKYPILRYAGVIASSAKGAGAAVPLTFFPAVTLVIAAQWVVDDKCAAIGGIGIGLRRGGGSPLSGSTGEGICIRSCQRVGGGLLSRLGGSGGIGAAESGR